MSSLLQLVTFRVHDMRLGVDIQSVAEVLPNTPVSHVPAAPPFLAGVIQWRGRVVPVIDLRKRFGLPAAETADRTRIVLATAGADVVGLIVDGMASIVKVERAQVQTPPAAMASHLAAYFTGVVRVGEDLVIVIDTGRVVSAGEASEIRKVVGG